MRALAFAVLLLVLTGCGAKDSEYRPIAEAFAAKLVARDFAGAHAMLATPPALTREELQAKFDDMTSWMGPASKVDVTQTMTDWPGKQAGDVGWAYVSIAGDAGLEGIAVVITRDKRVRSIEWGRP